MSVFADRVLGFTYFFFLFIILVYCLYKTLSGQYGEWAILGFLFDAACGYAWLTTAMLITALACVIRFLSVIISIAIAAIIIGRRNMPGYHNGLTCLVFMLSVIYFWIATIIT